MKVCDTETPGMLGGNGRKTGATVTVLSQWVVGITSMLLLTAP
jgi:hypothetical protein